jgi:hypothetical protein
MNFEMFDPWPIDVKRQETANEFFKLRDDPVANGAHLQFNYALEMRRDRVEANEIARFNDMVRKVKDSIGYTLRYSTPEQLKEQRKPSTFNWAVGAAALCFFSTAAFAAWYYFRHSKLVGPLPLSQDATTSPSGIGGWLILLAIGHVLRPIGFIKALYTLCDATMDTNSWRTLTDPIESTYNAWWAPTLLFELLFNLGCLVFCGLLIALFFSKRAAWRRCFVVFLIATVVGNLIDTLLAYRIPAAAAVNSKWDIVGPAMAAVIWIPYALTSKRVKATFRY